MLQIVPIKCSSACPPMFACDVLEQPGAPVSTSRFFPRGFVSWLLRLRTTKPQSSHLSPQLEQHCDAILRDRSGFSSREAESQEPVLAQEPAVAREPVLR